MPDFVLDVPQGADVVRAIIAFARSGHHTTGTVLFASGTVDRLHLYNPGALSPPVELPGAYRLVSFSGYFTQLTGGDYIWWSFSVVVASENGNVLGGELAGPIVASEPVLVVLSVLENPSHLGFPTQGAANGSQHNAAALENGSSTPAANQENGGR